MNALVNQQNTFITLSNSINPDTYEFIGPNAIIWIAATSASLVEVYFNGVSFSQVAVNNKEVNFLQEAVIV